MVITDFLFKAHLEDGETISYVGHKHPFLFHKPFLKVFFIGLVPPLILIYLFPPFLLVGIIWVIVASLKLFYVISDWYFDAWLITTLSILDVEWNGFFNRSSTRVEYHNIEGVSYAIKGFWGTVLNYGDIMLEKMGTGTVVTLENARKPKEIERNVLRAQEHFVREKNFKDHSVLKDMLATMIQSNAVQDNIGTILDKDSVDS